MSIKIMNMVFERYPHGGGEMVLALALADHAHDDGSHIYPSVDHLAQKTRQSRRTVQYQLRAMLEAGWLCLTNDGNGGRGRHREYRISPLWQNGADFARLKTAQTDAGNGANGDEKGCKPLHPPVNHEEPSVNRQAAKRLPADWALPKTWGEWALAQFPLWTEDTVRRTALMFKNHWIAKAGRDAAKRDWFATWQNWCLKEPADPGTGGKGALPWWATDAGVLAKGLELQLRPHNGETMMQFKGRIQRHIEHGPPPPPPPAASAAPPPPPVQRDMSPAAIAARRAALNQALQMTAARAPKPDPIPLPAAGGACST